MAATNGPGLVIIDGFLDRYKGDGRDVRIPDSVTCIGDAAFMDCSSLESVKIPASVSSVGHAAFKGCSSLVSVVIPDSVTSIGVYAFMDCSSLESVKIPGSVTSISNGAFARCSSLVAVTIPDSVTSIGDRAFYGCSSLVSVAIPDSVTSIEDGAFYGCSSLVSVTIPDSVTSIGDAAFKGCSSLVPRGEETDMGDFLAACESGDTETVRRLARDLEPDSGRDVLAQGIAVATTSGATEVVEFLQPIADVLGADSGPRDDSSLHAPDAQNAWSAEEPKRDVREAAEMAISNLESQGEHPDFVISDGVLLKYEGDGQHVTIPDSVTSIGEWAFNDCSSLVSVTIPDSVRSIGDSTFNECSSLAAVTIPDSVTSIGDGAFDQCSSLASVTIPDSVTAIGNGVFCECSSLAAVTIPDSVTSIGRVAFGGCTSLVSVTIPKSVTSIGNYAFSKCRSLASVTIPDSVTSIGEGAFLECASLASVTIPDSVTLIGKVAFARCSSLVSVTLPYSDVPIGEGAFLECASLASVFIPALDEQIAVCRRSEDRYLLQVALGDRANVHIQLFAQTQNESHLSEAAVYLTEREAICREMGIADGLANALIGQGTHVPSARQGDLPFIEEMRTKALEALGIYERVGDTAAMAEAHRVLAGLLVFLRDYAQALAHNERSAELFDEVGDTEKAQWLRTSGSENIRESQGLESGGPTPQGFVPDGAPVQAEQTPRKDHTAPQQAPRKGKKDSATPFAAELKALASRNEDARQEAAQALADAGEAALPALLEGLSVRSRDCRKWCAGLLKEHARLGESFVRAPQVVEALAAGLDDPDWETRRYRAAALGYIGTPEALRHLREVRDSEDEVTHAAALAGLYAAGDEDAHAQLLKMVADASADGRWVAVLSLDLASKPGVDLEVLKSALSDRSKYVREAAESAISNLEASGTGESETASHSSTTAAATESSKRSATEVLAELVNSVSGSWATYPKPEERARLIKEFAAHGTRAIDALERMSDMLSAPDVTTMPNEDQMRHIQWAVGRIDARGSAKRLLKYGFQAGPEMIIQAVRAVVRSGSSEEVDLVGLEQRLGPEVHKERQATRMLNDVLLAFFLAVEDEGVSSPETSRERATFLLENFDTAMRWESRIHTEREYGVITEELDPLYARVESLLRSVKRPYYFRNAADRAARIAKHGHDTDGLVLSSSEVERIRVGDVVTVYLEHEHELGYYWTAVSVRVVDEPRDTPAGRLFVGEVQSTGDWLGPYVLEKGERVLFLGSNIHGTGD